MSKLTDPEIIDALGGPTAVSKLCGITQPSVSEWKHNGIPKGWRNYFTLLRPDLFNAGKKKSGQKH